jgi:hypothetical protein
MGAEGGKGTDACGCGDLSKTLEKFFADAPAWALVLIGVVGGAIFFKGSR